ncbi:MAG TPA: ATP-binding protein [Sedimentisphaerales bacterium]|nr:ATP-binding protein [Sedimentisphaerales bacterium]
MTKQAIKYEDVSAEPVKSFFVDMLTRDIDLGDAILDLLDNCVDGILRKKSHVSGKHPYQGFYAEVNYNGDEFTITDNCGGIPWDLHDYAFRMGPAGPKPRRSIPTVGVYGIGMKRALFKIGQHSLIRTQHKNDAYEVEIKPTWLKEEGNWTMPVHASKSRMGQDGTSIVIRELNEGAKSLFGDDKTRFDRDFKSKLEGHYAFIINKGFEVKVNGDAIKPRPTELRFEKGEGKTAIRPFIYETEVDGVEVFLAVGFTHPIPSEDDITAEQEHKQYSSLDAGWTVVCNDRAVLYCDRTELTGWGEAGVPKYHTQFIAISGIVEFRSNDASKLPTTTTKRGIDASSRLYLQVKNKMREGLGIFTSFTNKWKGRQLAKQAQNLIRRAEPQSFHELKERSANLTLSTVSTGAKGRQFKPRLPMPRKSIGDTQRICFDKYTKDIRDVSDHLFGDSDVDASRVGSRCFDHVLEEARK